MLTDSQLRSIKPSRRPQKLSDTAGLYILVTPNGGRYWRYSYRFNWKQKTLALGVYPDVKLAQAREHHQEARRQLMDGIDPSAKKQASVKTFEVVAREWHAHWAVGRGKQHADYVLRRIEAPQWAIVNEHGVQIDVYSGTRENVCFRRLDRCRWRRYPPRGSVEFRKVIFAPEST